MISSTREDSPAAPTGERGRQKIADKQKTGTRKTAIQFLPPLYSVRALFFD